MSRWDPRDEHEGWTNIATWAVAEHINADPARLQSILDLIRSARDADPGVDGVTHIMAVEAGYRIRATITPAPVDVAKVNWAELGSVFLEELVAREAGEAP